MAQALLPLPTAAEGTRHEERNWAFQSLLPAWKATRFLFLNVQFQSSETAIYIYVCKATKPQSGTRYLSPVLKVKMLFRGLCRQRPEMFSGIHTIRQQSAASVGFGARLIKFGLKPPLCISSYNLRKYVSKLRPN